MSRPFGMSEEDYEDAKSEFAGELAQRRAERCTCGRDEPPGSCEGCERSAAREIHEAEERAEERAIAAGKLKRCEDCGEAKPPAKLLNGLCASCAKWRDKAQANAGNPQAALGLDDEDLPF
jgi:tRNA(Ile)-lysidine synthase TilS/MesJ